MRELYDGLILFHGSYCEVSDATLAAYIGGAFGPVGSRGADDICISLLLPEKLKDQYCFRTETAINCLEFVESEKVWIRK